MTLALLGADAAAKPLAFVGVSLSGAEFGSATPGATGKAGRYVAKSRAKKVSISP